MTVNSPILNSFNLFLSLAKILALNLKTYPVTLNNLFIKPYLEQSMTLPKASYSTLLTAATAILILLSSKLISLNGKVASFGDQFLDCQARTVEHESIAANPNELRIWNELNYLLGLMRMKYETTCLLMNLLE